MVNKNILIIRKKLDKLDNSLIKIIKKRTKLVDRVIQNKQFKKDIVDKKRISIILRNIKIKSKKKGVDPQITLKIWKAMIRAFIDYEFRNFKKIIIYCEVVIFFSTKYSCFLVLGLYFLSFNLSLAFSPFVGFFA